MTPVADLTCEYWVQLQINRGEGRDLFYNAYLICPREEIKHCLVSRLEGELADLRKRSLAGESWTVKRSGLGLGL